jgi:hypothetical protein
MPIWDPEKFSAYTKKVPALRFAALHFGGDDTGLCWVIIRRSR